MNRLSTGWIVCLLLCGMLIAGVFYLIGYKAAYDRMENTVPSTVEVSVAWQKVSPCGSGWAGCWHCRSCWFCRS